MKTKKLDYHPKIILAWAKAIEGNQDLLSFLKDNYEELFMATYALRLKDEAREWLMQNGYPHLMAFINGAEGNEQAMTWLKVNGFEVLYYMAHAVDGEYEGEKGFAWLKKHATQDLFILAKCIKTLKDGIEEGHNDVHTISRD